MQSEEREGVIFESGERKGFVRQAGERGFVGGRKTSQEVGDECGGASNTARRKVEGGGEEKP